MLAAPWGCTCVQRCFNSSSGDHGCLRQASWQNITSGFKWWTDWQKLRCCIEGEKALEVCGNDRCKTPYCKVKLHQTKAYRQTWNSLNVDFCSYVLWINPQDQFFLPNWFLFCLISLTCWILQSVYHSNSGASHMFTQGLSTLSTL